MNRFPFGVRWSRTGLAVACVMLAGIGTGANLGDSLPADTHMALWVDNLTTAIEGAETNSFYNLLREDIGTPQSRRGERETIGHVMRRLPFSASDPLFPLWSELLPNLDERLQSAMAKGTSVFGVSADDVLDTFSQSIALYSTLYSPRANNATNRDDWDVIFAAEFLPEEREKVDAFLAAALRRVPDSARRTRAVYSNTAIDRLEYYVEERASLFGNRDPRTDLGLTRRVPVIVEHAIVDGVFYLAEGNGEPLKKALRARFEGGSQLLSSRERFQYAAKALEANPGHINLFFDIGRHIASIADDRSQEKNYRLMKALGLENSGPILARASIDDQGASLRAVIPAPPRPAGVFEVLAESPENRMERLSLVPADALLASSLSLDFETLYAEYSAAMLVMNQRNQRLVDTALSSIEGLTGVNLRQTILAETRGEAINYVRPSTEDTTTAGPSYSASFFFPLSGRAETTNAINAILRQLNSDQTRFLDLVHSDFNGHTLWESAETVVSQNGRDSIHAAVMTNGVILSTSGAELRDLVRRTDTPPRESILDTPEFQSMMAKLPEKGVRALVYQPAKSVIDLYIQKHYFIGNPEGDVETARAELAGSVGTSWWMLESSDADILFEIHLEDPQAEKP